MFYMNETATEKREERKTDRHAETNIGREQQDVSVKRMRELYTVLLFHFPINCLVHTLANEIMYQIKE